MAAVTLQISLATPVLIVILALVRKHIVMLGFVLDRVVGGD